MLQAINGMIGRISYKVTELTARISAGRTKDLVVHHEIQGVTPEMIDWWWDHIGDTERYRLWHPKSHQFFTWEAGADGAHVGRGHRVVEKIAGIPTMLRIRWEEEDTVPVDRMYGHVNVGSILDSKEIP